MSRRYPSSGSFGLDFRERDLDFVNGSSSGVGGESGGVSASHKMAVGIGPKKERCFSVK